jgi:chlorite dismutase
MTNAATVTDNETTSPPKKAPLRRQFVNFAVYQVDPEWRRLSKEECQRGKRQVEDLIDHFNEKKICQILTFSTMGMRADGDFLLWIIAYELEAIQELATALLKTDLGKYLKRTHSFLSMTKRSLYLDRFNPEHAEDRVHLLPGKYKYFFVYPFVKKREWYVLPLPERQKMMDEHIRIGNKYPSVKLNTTYSFGLDDQEFVVAFETDSAADFLDLVQELRESQASMYTLRDTPIISCIKKTPKETLDSLGA